MPVDAPRRPLSRSAKVQLVVLAVNVVFWGAILAWTVVADPGDPPDFLDDRSFPAAAEPICAAAVAEVATFGNPAFVDSIEERADLVDRETAVFDAMVTELRALPRPAGEQGEWVAVWLDDWDVHIEDRRRWAERLHDGEDPPFVETARGNDQISRVVDEFAEVNQMASCATLGDV
jgi:hypothetical protein